MVLKVLRVHKVWQDLLVQLEPQVLEALLEQLDLRATTVSKAIAVLLVPKDLKVLPVLKVQSV